MRQWLITNFAFVTGLELHYKRIPPRIIAEEYLENSDGDIYDYKLWCFEGKVHSVMFLSERKTGDLKMAFYNQDWERLDLSYHFTRDPKQMPRPEQLEQMIAISERLSEGSRTQGSICICSITAKSSLERSRSRLQAAPATGIRRKRIACWVNCSVCRRRSQSHKREYI
jgi:hypothetical protein